MSGRVNRGGPAKKNLVDKNDFQTSFLRRSIMDVTTSTLQLNTPEGRMEAFEARPKNAGSYPGIVVLMEAFGLNDHIKKVTERIAQEGYVAVAPDLYHLESERIVPYSDLQKAIGIMNRLQDPKVMDDVGGRDCSFEVSKQCEGGFHWRDWFLHGRSLYLSFGGASQPGREGGGCVLRRGHS